jgi:hypothetical protein
MRCLITILLLICNISVAQIYEVGFFVGGSNFVGDLGETTYINPNALAVGGILKWNRSPRHALRASFIYTQLRDLDSKSNDPKRVQRDLDFEYKALEASIGVEFTFFDFDLHDDDLKQTPYLYTGISLLSYPGFYFENNIKINENSRFTTFGIPMSLGYKAQISPHIILAAEISARYSFSDALDGSVPSKQAPNNTNSFGNLNNNDWYVFSGISLTYTFGRKPCYCSF